MIIVTGAAGFIGSCIVAKLNELGHDDLILVDHIADQADMKKENIRNKRYNKYFDKAEFLQFIKTNQIDLPVDSLIHMGACSSTVLQDAQYFEENNFQYSRTLAQWALDHQVRFIYASSAATYGDGLKGYRDDEQTIRQCEPLNLYGESKQKFDLWVLEQKMIEQVVGLKFFNVFGPNEYHKGEMRSVVAKAYPRVAEEGKIALFKSYKEEYADGEQKRDFIYVKDAVDVVMYFFQNPQINGIYNLGTGQARSWNDLSRALFKAVQKEPVIEYIEMPEILKPRYQYFTQADISKLRTNGYHRPFTELEDAVYDYIQYLRDGRYW